MPTVPNNFAREHFPEGTTVRRSDCYTSKRFRRWTEAQWSANGWGNNIIMYFGFLCMCAHQNFLRPYPLYDVIDPGRALWLPGDLINCCLRVCLWIAELIYKSTTMYVVYVINRLWSRLSCLGMGIVQGTLSSYPISAFLETDVCKLVLMQNFYSLKVASIS